MQQVSATETPPSTVKPIQEMLGRTFVAASVNDDDEEMLFTDAEGKWVKFYHSPGCCETVQINDVCGDLQDLVGSPIVLAESVSQEGAAPPEGYAESYTWTFYRFATVKGTVTVRWLGTSNGYYSEEVNLATSEDDRGY